MPMKKVTVRRWEVAVAFLLITVAFVVGLWQVTNLSNGVAHDRVERARQLNAFLSDQCARDHLRDRIFISVLKGARRDYTREIHALEFIDRNCTRSIPPVTPK